MSAPVSKWLFEEFHDLAQWNAWRHKNLPTRQIIDEIGERIIAQGFTEPLTGLRAQPNTTRVTGGNWREGLTHEGINSRVRAVLLVMDRLLAQRNRRMTRIYAAEAVTSFAMRMRGIFPRFIGSEYAATPEDVERLFPISLEDLTALSFKDGAFRFRIDERGTGARP